MTQYNIWYYKNIRNLGVDDRILYNDRMIFMRESDIQKTHTVLLSADFENLDDAFRQLNFWTPDVKMVDYIVKNKLHTSMSVGDIAYDCMRKKYFMCVPAGWKQIHILPEAK